AAPPGEPGPDGRRRGGAHRRGPDHGRGRPRGAPRRRSRRPDRDRVRAAAVPHAQPAAGAVQGPDPRPGLELRLRRPGARRRVVHQLPAQEDRRGPGTAHPHRPRRRLRPEAHRLMLSPAWLGRLGRLGFRGKLVSRPMAVKRLRLRILLPRTLRGRLIAGLVALLAVGCATVGVVTYFAVQGALSRELNGELQTATSLAYNCWERQDNDAEAPLPASGQSGTPKSDSGSTGKSGAGLASAAAHTTAWLGGAGTSDTPGSSPSGAATTPVHLASTEMGECQGLGEQTFIADVSHGQWGQCVLIGERKAELSPADKKTLASITPVPAEGPRGVTSGQGVHTSTRYLSVAKGTFELTVVRDRDGSVYFTGLPLAGLHDTLRDVALAEAAVFGAVLVLAGVLGTFWVRFSLRPLRRVATTASQVAELP